MEEKATKYLKLPFNFDKIKLLHDLSSILESKWIPHFNSGGYSGDWKIVPLYAYNGNEQNIFAHAHSDAKIEETPILDKCPYLKTIIDTFKVPILSARIMRLGIGAEIKPHRDHELGYENNSFRLHIPIITNDDVSFILDGIRIKMLPGECWCTNVNYEHSVSNHGTTDRVHLVIDGKRNQWSDDLFFSLAPKESFSPQVEPDSPDTIRKTIEALKLLNEPVAKSLIEELQTKLDNLKNN